MSDYTPGPWTVSSLARLAWVQGGEDVVVRSDGLKETKNREANARLIAAAPDLLARCQDALWIFEIQAAFLAKVTGTDAKSVLAQMEPTITQMRAAIAKATGK